MPNLRELNIFIRDTDGQLKPFQLVITEPEKTINGNDHFCRISAPTLFKDEKRIFGANADQATSLSIKFINELLVGRQLIGEDGKPLAL